MEKGDFVWVEHYRSANGAHVREDRLGIILEPSPSPIDTHKVLVATALGDLLEVRKDGRELAYARPVNFKKRFLRQGLALLAEYQRREIALLREEMRHGQIRKIA